MEASKEKTVLPKWALGPLHSFRDYIFEAERILSVSVRGMLSIEKLPPVVQAIAELERLDSTGEAATKDRQKELESVREDAKFAEQERKNGFARLNAHAVVSIWGALETLVEDVVVAWLVNIPDTLKRDEFQRIRVPLAEYEAMDAREDRMRFLLQELKRSLQTEQKRGVNQFESLLRTVALDGAVVHEVKKDLFEMQQVRHVIVHRASVADKRLQEACPWLGVVAGTPIRVTQNDFARYFVAATKYFVELVKRMQANLSISRAPERRVGDSPPADSGAQN